METSVRDDTDDEAGAAKLIPEWSVDADDQVILAGLAAFLGILLFFGWGLWRGGDDESVISVASSVVSGGVTQDADLNGSGDPAVVAAPTTASTTASTEPTTTLSPATTASTSTTSAAAPTIGDVQAAVGTFPGAIVGTNDGAIAVLEGFVANQAERDEAEAAAASTEGIEEVRNNLVILEPPVTAALGDNGVVQAGAAGVGTEITVTGTLQSEDDRAPALAAAAAVEGVTNVIDQLTVSIAADLNELPQVQFATGSAEILPASFADLDAAAELIQSAGEVQLLIEGWTDVRGNEADNLTLSQNRADAVRQYLLDAGVDDGALAAVGNGETTEFAEGDSDEALQANRVVLFSQVG